MTSRLAVIRSLYIGFCAFCRLPGPPALAGECARPERTCASRCKGKIVRSQIKFMQGLEWRDGKLLESTGAIGGHSGLNIIAPDGTVTSAQRRRGRSIFGEGLTVLNDEIYPAHLARARGVRLRPFRQAQAHDEEPARGWGLTNDGTQSHFQRWRAVTLCRRSPHLRDRSARSDQDRRPRRLFGLNELELIDGKLYGNLFQTNTILRIDPASGCVEARADIGFSGAR